MIRYATSRRWLFTVGALVISLTNAAHSQDQVDRPVSPSAKQNNPPGSAREPVKTYAGAITEGDRIIRLDTSIDTYKKQLGELETELERTKSEEGAANKAVEQVAKQIENMEAERQKADDAGDQFEAEKLRIRLAEVEGKLLLAKEQFDLAIRNRKTIQEQIVTFQQKITNDQAALDKLKGVSPPEPANGEPSTSTTSAVPATSDSPTSSLQDPVAEPPGTDRVETDVTPVSKELAKALEAVRDQSKALQSIEQDLDALADSKTLLEKSIALESEKLNNARMKYDSLENANALAESEFSEKLAAGTPAAELQQLRKQSSDSQQKLHDSRGEMRTSTDRLQELRNQLLALQTEELRLVKLGEELRREMNAAKRSEWLLKARDYLYNTIPKIIAILVLTIVVWVVIKLLCRRSRGWLAHAGRGTQAERQNRADTLIGVFRSTGNIVVVIGSLMMILDTAGVPITALLGGAGVVGLAVAFGAQSLMKDYFCGFILLMENQYKVNDWVTIGGQTGLVERITLRVTVLRDFEGKVYFIPNGQITSVTNATLDWSRAVFEIGVAYKENVDQVIAELRQVTIQMREDSAYSDFILGDVEMLGVDNLGDSSVVIKFGVKTRPDKKWPVKRELLRRIKNAFDERGIEIPFPHRTVIHRTEVGSPANVTIEPLKDQTAQP